MPLNHTEVLINNSWSPVVAVLIIIAKPEYFILVSLALTAEHFHGWVEKVKASFGMILTADLLYWITLNRCLASRSIPFSPFRVTEHLVQNCSWWHPLPVLWASKQCTSLVEGWCLSNCFLCSNLWHLPISLSENAVLSVHFGNRRKQEEVTGVRGQSPTPTPATGVAKRNFCRKSPSSLLGVVCNFQS